MSGLEVTGLLLRIFPVVIDVVRRGEELRSVFDGKFLLRSQWPRILRRHGPITTLYLFALFRDALDVMERIETSVLPTEPQHAISFMKSFSSSFTMIGVAGAIIAQVAITALSLDGLAESHWTAEAPFVVSLVTGALSVYCSCIVHPAMLDLHSAQDIKDWLSIPYRSKDSSYIYTWRDERQLRIALIELEAAESTPSVQQLRQQYDPRLDHSRWQIASANSAMMLVAPSKLLSISLNAFMIGLGIYLGFAYTANLIPSFGSSGSLAILIIYIICVIYGLALYFLPAGMKSVEIASTKRFEKSLEDASLFHPRRETSQRHSIPTQQRNSDGHRSPHNTTEERPGSSEFELHERRPNDGSGSIQPNQLSAQTPNATTIIPNEEASTPEPALQQQPQTLSTDDSRSAPERDHSFQVALEQFIRIQEQSTQAARTLLQSY